MKLTNRNFNRQALTAFVVFGACLVHANPLFSFQENQDKKPEKVSAIVVETLADDIDAGTGGLVIDAQGNVITADFGWRLDGPGKGGDKVFKVDPTGKIKLFCREMRGASGNALDSHGNLFQSSIGGSFVSKVTPAGEVSVFCKEGLSNPVGIAVDKDNNLFVNNCGSGSIQKITPDGTSTVFCKSNLLRCPNGITFADDGNLYVANFYNGDVIKVDPSGAASKLVTLPGNNNGHLTFFQGDLYVIARTANQVYRVSLDGESTLFVGSGKRGKTDGAPLESSLSLPNDIGVSPDGKYMYINETSPIEGDPKILGPTRIRRIELSGAEPKTEKNATATPKASIDELSWIAGHWQGEAMGGKFEETWNAPMGGAMMGMFKFVQDEKIEFYEILTIVPKDDSLVLRLKHFSSDLIGWEEKDKSVEFPFRSLTENEAKFDGLVFTRIDENEMHIEVVVKQGQSKPQKLKFECHRVGR